MSRFYIQNKLIKVNGSFPKSRYLVVNPGDFVEMDPGARRLMRRQQNLRGKVRVLRDRLKKKEYLVRFFRKRFKKRYETTHIKNSFKAPLGLFRGNARSHTTYITKFHNSYQRAVLAHEFR